MGLTEQLGNSSPVLFLPLGVRVSTLYALKGWRKESVKKAYKAKYVDSRERKE